MRGQLTIINVYECDEGFVKSKARLTKFCGELCKVIKMKAYGKPIVDRFGKGELEGWSGVQRIETSSIVVHMDEFENKVFIDIFSCKNFGAEKARDFSRKFFKARKAICKTVMRK